MLLLCVVAWWVNTQICIQTHVYMHKLLHELKHKLRRLLINFFAARGRDGCMLQSSEGLMGSWEVQARWLKTQATDVSGTLQSGAPACASTGHDALLRGCPPDTWRWHHMPGPPGTIQSRGWHSGSLLPAQTQLSVWWRASGEMAHMLNTNLKGTKLGDMKFANLT